LLLLFFDCIDTFPIAPVGLVLSCRCPWPCCCSLSSCEKAVLSSALFNIFISDFPALAALLINFADDFYVGAKSVDLNSLTDALNADLALVEEWALSNNLKIAPEKSSVTPDPHQTNYHPQVYLQGSLVPLAKITKWLGINVYTKINSS
jgi:hypothetical protein